MCCCGCVCMALADHCTKLWYPWTKDTDVQLKYCKGLLYAGSVRIETQALVPLIIQSTSPKEQADSQADRNLFHRTCWHWINSIVTRIFIELFYFAFTDGGGNKWDIDGENINQWKSCGHKKKSTRLQASESLNIPWNQNWSCGFYPILAIKPSKCYCTSKSLLKFTFSRYLKCTALLFWENWPKICMTYPALDRFSSNQKAFNYSTFGPFPRIKRLHKKTT